MGRAFRDTLIDFINSKNMINHDGQLDLSY